MSQPRLPSSFGKRLVLTTKGNLQPGVGDTHYVCADQDTHGQPIPDASNPVPIHHEMAQAGSPGPGSIPYLK